MARVTLAGEELVGFAVDEPAASVRLLLPAPSDPELVLPTWRGNEFLLADDRRPTIRTFTPWRTEPDQGELDLGVVLHGAGAASEWAGRVAEGDEAAVSGPGRGYSITADAPAYLVAGDETALPAISQLVAALPDSVPVAVHVEIADPSARGLALPEHPAATVEWHHSTDGDAPGSVLVAAVRGADIEAGTQVWAAGEAAAMQRIRRHLFDERGLTRAQATVRGYWKHGRAGAES
jgi:NADPH-dependent ferric siderophore reductase